MLIVPVGLLYVLRRVLLFLLIGVVFHLFEEVFHLFQVALMVVLPDGRVLAGLLLFLLLLVLLLDLLLDVVLQLLGVLTVLATGVPTRLHHELFIVLLIPCKLAGLAAARPYRHASLEHHAAAVLLLHRYQLLALSHTALELDFLLILLSLLLILNPNLLRLGLQYQLLLVVLPELDKASTRPFSYVVLSHANLEPTLARVFVITAYIIVGLLRLGCGCQELLLLLENSLLGLFLLLLGFRVFGLDDGQVQVEQEEGTEEDKRHEEEDDKWRVGLLVHDHDVRPALERHALENVE